MATCFPLDQADFDELLELALDGAQSAADRTGDFAQIESFVGSAQQEGEHFAPS
jgi:hypothetical protein